MDHIASDMVDLTQVSIGTLRGLPPSARTRRLLDEVRRGRSNAMGDGGQPASQAH
ncbi:aldo/keto reductase [Streptomyces hainanensis]|uniref:Aldo/keto reductase n=1 Tax=Streptomyces hainanensis TaxID=402648 RepID=A0A4R4THI8_9ACTN|nr:aldo/keto reductase [Streptomyces hainanensis]TDC73809.1 aldo/keto reductase [Streptomyces hainanensis]